MTSPPGALSQRTDKQPINVPTGLPYGDAQQLHSTEASAAMSASPKVPTPDLGAMLGGGGGGGGGVQPPPMFSEPTQFPDQPVTHGAASGPGAGLEAISPGAPTPVPGGGPISQAIARAAAVDTSGTLAALLSIAQAKGL